MREVVLDTETTGLDPAAGHRIVEIGCVALVDQIITERKQWYLNPERDMPEEAYRVHGLSEEFLREKPVFADVVDDFLAFIGDAQLVIHNADFDMGFINAELKRAGRSTLDPLRATDTVALARKKFPGSPANLDALCKRFNIDNSTRTVHGALLDSELLSDVYVELLGGRQKGLAFDTEVSSGPARPAADRVLRPARPHAPSDEERARHAAFMEKLDEPLWSA